MRTIEAKIPEATHLELSEPVSVPAEQRIEISITDEQTRESSGAGSGLKPEASPHRVDAPRLPAPRRSRELAWGRSHEDVLQAYAGQWVALEGGTGRPVRYQLLPPRLEVT